MGFSLSQQPVGGRGRGRSSAAGAPHAGRGNASPLTPPSANPYRGTKTILKPFKT
jgi:hypothetical protein